MVQHSYRPHFGVLPVLSPLHFRSGGIFALLPPWWSTNSFRYHEIEVLAPQFLFQFCVRKERNKELCSSWKCSYYHLNAAIATARAIDLITSDCLGDKHSTQILIILSLHRKEHLDYKIDVCRMDSSMEF